MTECHTSLSANASAKGKVLLPDGGTVPVNVFLGVPYAQPPVGELRFCPPQPQVLWTGERDCTEFGASPMQPVEVSKQVHDKLKFPDVFSEDSLFLNVYTPSLKPDARLPVMVWIYGGGFSVGITDAYDGTALAGFHDVIVVTVNYRLGPFGFFTTGDDVIPGNNGLLDQVEALRWIQKHVTSFGGDPENVTIFGESAGGMSCSLHVVSEVPAGLFRRAIIQSGPATSAFAVTTQAKLRAALQPKLEKMEYKGSTSEELVAFLRSRPAEELAEIDMTFQIFKPVIDGNYLKDYPSNIYADLKFQNVEIMSGSCSHEGYMGVKFGLADPNLPTTKEDLRKYLHMTLNPLFPDNTAILDAIYDRYHFDDAVGNADLFRQRFVNVGSDSTFFASNVRLTCRHACLAPVYVYLYSYRASFVPSETEAWVGADHGHEIFTALGLGFTKSYSGWTQTETDAKVSRMMMAYWTNFARNGDPNGPGLTPWSQFNSNTKEYIVLNETAKLAADFEPERMKFWIEDIPKLDTSRVYKMDKE